VEIVPFVETPTQVKGKKFAHGGLSSSGDAHQDDYQESSISEKLMPVPARLPSRTALF
jgi:hypothetical protein